MPRFLTGDELGNIKSITYLKGPEWKLDEQMVFTPPAHAYINAGELEAEKAKDYAIQKLSILTGSGSTVLAAARSNGMLSTIQLTKQDGKLEVPIEWRESRFKAGHRFVGLDLSPKGLFWCTSNGALGFSGSKSDSEDSPTLSQKAALPMRLCAWRLSTDYSMFAYGGDEVDLSVWDTTRAFQQKEASSKDNPTAMKKRKRGGELFPGEIWRAKNLPNDFLSLHQPVHITSLSYLSPAGSSGQDVQLVTGTEAGDVRRYDTRAARRPVANWTSIACIGGVSVVQAGLSEHELFVADSGSNLLALDLRNGRTIYSYKKLQGAVTSLSPSAGGFLGSTSRDRFFRLHTTFPPPETAGRLQEERGDVIASAYMKSVPTAVVFDDESSGRFGDSKTVEDDTGTGSDEGEGDIWAEMQDVEDSDDEHTRSRKGSRQS